ncbi:LLM class flavin-dependent oxidoreductase [Vineibacter terrae]|uniref:LLM class flavin-dependent oxidoreductase n=1 Tax=Vineibacter terrae TaxID=2586908 RepID=A0A5C8PKR4_9HYPH|nr:LLM class flavin-dependent oxidoreductase [Vineibacter terrae]TXL74488.1 LLM class flavin-dependent oxidoreductase [Vineibacter terrae]
MEIGMFHEFQCPHGYSEARAFAESFEQVDAAERWGLDCMWLAELHIAPTRSVLSAPLAIASAIAARTTRMKIGIAVQVLPLCHPLRIAEEAATVDHVSHGRLIFGVGRSGFPRTYMAYGVPYAESQARFAETLEIIRRAWTLPSFSYSGTFHSFSDVHLVPKPYQKPHPPIRVAATSPDTYAMVGALGFPIFVAVRLGVLSELVPLIAEYHAAWRAAGHPGKGEVYLRVPVYVAPTEAQARDEPRASIMQFYQEMAAIIAQSATQAGTRAIENRAGRAAHLKSVSYEEAMREKVIVGTPDQVAARLQALRAELGLDGILAEMNCGALIPHAQVLRSLELLCKEVMPQVKG